MAAGVGLIISSPLDQLTPNRTSESTFRWALVQLLKLFLDEAWKRIAEIEYSVVGSPSYNGRDRQC
jgi:hypothetical protein